MQQRGLSAATIKTDLSAIRFWHDKIPGTRYRLPGNNELDLDRRKFGGVDRTWSQGEFDRMVDLCPIARKAVKTGALHIKGKGGKIRDVELNEPAKTVLAARLYQTKPGHKLFVPVGKDTHIAIKEL